MQNLLICNFCEMILSEHFNGLGMQNLLTADLSWGREYRVKVFSADICFGHLTKMNARPIDSSRYR